MEEQKTEEEGILDDALSMEGYDKPVRKARNVLFVVAGVQLISLFLLPDMEPDAKVVTIGIVVFVAAIFVALGFWTKRKPYTAIITALIVYTSLIIIDAIAEPASIFQGFILKIAVYSLLIASLGNSREVQRWKDMTKK